MVHVRLRVGSDDVRWVLLLLELLGLVPSRERVVVGRMERYCAVMIHRELERGVVNGVVKGLKVMGAS